MIPSVFPLSRRKSVPRWVRIAYLFKRGARVFGQRAWLRLWLNAAWVTNRIAREVCFDTNRADFRKAGQALSEELLARWLPANSAVLDIGCGLGEWSRIASKYAARVVGIDLNASYIAQNQTSHLPHNVLFMLSDATTGLPEQRFDVVLMIHLIEHIEDPSLLLRQARDKARILIIEVPNFEGDALNFIRYRVGCIFYTDGDHVCEYRPCGLTEQLNVSGWEVKEIVYRSGCMVAMCNKA